MSNLYSIDELARMSAEELYGLNGNDFISDQEMMVAFHTDPIERDRRLEVQADIDMDNDPAYNVDWAAEDAIAEQQAEGAWLRQAESQGWQDAWQERLNEDIQF